MSSLRNLKVPLFVLALVTGGAGSVVYKVHWDQTEQKRLMRQNLKRDFARIAAIQKAKQETAKDTACETGLCDLKPGSSAEDVAAARAQADASFRGKDASPARETGLCDLKPGSSTDDVESARAAAAAQFRGQ